ncbi:MAG: adenylyltransferase/cytidyltransferase family protein [Lachnospiraceae bacterium]|nr:adenylyltransferase/cytidyltransferase family protein [Lachnospiraceae bacterium]
MIEYPIDLLQQLKSGLIKWYNIPEGSHDLLLDDVGDVTLPLDQEYDHIFVSDGVERAKDPDALITDIAGALKDEGICLLAFNNRLGLKYFCGDTPPGEMFSREEISRMLTCAGFKRLKFYSVFSDLNNPSHIFAEGYEPKEDLANRFFPTYNTPDTVFRMEEELYRDLIDNGLFHTMANAFLVEASKSSKESFSDVCQVTSTMDRDPENAFLTIVRGNGTVVKKNISGNGNKRFEAMLSYAADLKGHGIDVVDMSVTKEGLSMPYIDAPTGQLALKEAMLRDRDEFYGMMDAFRDQILRSSEIVGEDKDLGPIARYGYIDMVPLNSFYVDGRFIFFDQEFRIENYPINAVIFRMIATFYFGNVKLEETIRADEVYERYGVNNNRERFIALEWDFLGPLRNEDKLKRYHEMIRRDDRMTVKNLEKMRMSADKYLEKYRNDSPKGNKPYHIGYVAGAFDMFHIGHLNLLRRAKERCDYLVAGVISDDRVYELKHRMPIIPCHERMQVVEGCRYVDEVIELPMGKAGIRDAYERVHFDCMFSGDDHADNPGWLSEQAYLRTQGSDIVFVSYTKETSTTDIRKKMNLQSNLLTDKNYKWIYTYDYAPESVWEPWRDIVYDNKGTGGGENVRGNQTSEVGPVDNDGHQYVPPWITEEAAAVSARIKKGLPSFILLADSHFTHNGTWEDTYHAMKAISKGNRIDGIIHLGDMSDGLLPLRKTEEIEKKCISDMESIGVPVYVVPGNHDYNYFKGNPDIKYPDMPQYHVDIADQKLRLIIIDSFDPKEEVRYGFSNGCITWLDECLTQMPEDYSAVIFSHLTPLVRLQAWTKDIRNRQKLIEVLDNHATKILAFINGHNHCDHIFNDLHNGQFPIISINCAKCEYFTDHKPVSAVVPERRLGDRTQESFDIMQVDTANKEIHFTRFGAGKDRVIKGGKGFYV